MGAADAVYNLFFKRSTLYVPFVLVGAFLANEGIDKAVNTMWESNNRGVRLLLSRARQAWGAHDRESRRRRRRRRRLRAQLTIRDATPLLFQSITSQKLFKDLPAPVSTE